MHDSAPHQLNTNLSAGAADHVSLMSAIASATPASRMNFFIIEFVDSGPHLNTGQDQMDEYHENDSEGCDCFGSRLFRTCILTRDGFNGAGRTDCAARPLLPVI
jgi:hypothetical protein